MKNPLLVTKSFLPPLEEYVRYLKLIWKNGVLTNDGRFVKQFEGELKANAGTGFAICTANATIALQLAMRTLPPGGEIITTPFSFIATTSSIMWEGFVPVYADIDPHTLNIDPKEIEKKITRKTKAILAVHVFGNPCDTEAIKKIAKKHKLTVIYDACHALGIKHKGKPLFSYGDISVTSFHATKLLNTAEGGAMFTNNPRTAKRLKLARNFGYENYVIHTLGINGKMNELSASLGLAGMKYLPKIIAKRKAAYNLYMQFLKETENFDFQHFLTGQNYSYLPVILRTEKLKKQLMKALNAQNIFPREYFSPSLETVFGGKPSCKNALDISKRILCLPLSVHITPAEIKKVCSTVNKVCAA